jgi:hypothetical protein
MRFRQFLFFALPLAALAFAGCSSSVMIGSDDGGTGSDAGPRADAGPGEPCGANTCTGDTYCCNASCGICAPEGAGCVAIACPEPVVCNGEVCEAEGATCCPGCFATDAFCSGPGGVCPAIDCPAGCESDADCGSGGRCCPGCDEGEGTCVDATSPCPELVCPPECGGDVCGADEQCCEGGCPGVADNCQPADQMCIIPDCPAPTCDPMRAYGQGECDAELGIRWNGDYCESVSGCDCVGGDCGRLYGSVSECEGYHGSCSAQAGCESDLECPEQMFCEGCARGSCPVCLDCRSDCRPLPCGHEGEPVCDESKPECGEGGVAIVKDGCWVCVDPNSCEEIGADDCRVTGCDADESCQVCFSGYVCLPDGAVC